MTALLSYTPPEERVSPGVFRQMIPGGIITHPRPAAPQKRPVPKRKRKAWGVGYLALDGNATAVVGCLILWGDASQTGEAVEKAAGKHLRKALRKTHPGFRLESTIATEVGKDPSQ